MRVLAPIRRTWRRSAATAFLALGLAVVAPVLANHDPVQTLSGGGTADEVYLGIDSNGTATAVWNERGRVFAGTRTLAEGGFRPAAVLDGSGYVDEVAFAQSPNGNAVVAWNGRMNEGELLAAVRLGADAPFGSPQVLDPPDGAGSTYAPHVAISDSGHAVVAWQHSTSTPNYQVRAALSDAAGTFGGAAILADAPGVQTPRVGMAASGAAVAVWGVYSQQVSEIRAAAAPPGGSFGPSTVVETLQQGPGHPDVAVNASGAAVLAYADLVAQRECPASGPCSRDKLEVRYGNVSGAFGASQAITNVGNPTAVREPRVAIDDSGRAAVIVYASMNNGHGLYGQISDTSGAFPQGQPQAVSAREVAGGPTAGRREFSLAAGGGEFTAFWANDHDADGQRNEAWMSTTGGGRFGEVHRVSPASSESASRAQGARNSSGATIAGWLLGYEVQASPARPLPPPTPVPAETEGEMPMGEEEMMVTSEEMPVLPEDQPEGGVEEMVVTEEG